MGFLFSGRSSFFTPSVGPASNVAPPPPPPPTPYPLTLPSLQCWFDPSQATSVTLSGSNITHITDLSGNGQNGAPANGADYPTYVLNAQHSLNVMSFIETASLQIANSTPNTPTCSVGGIIKTPASFVDTYYLFEVLGQNAMNIYMTGSSSSPYPAGQLQADAGQDNIATVNVLATLTTSTWYRIIMVWDSTLSTPSQRLKIYVNGADATNVLSGTGYGNVVGTSPITVGFPSGTGNTGVGSIPGYYAEFVSTNAAMTVGQITGLDNYWTAKWGL